MFRAFYLTLFSGLICATFAVATSQTAQAQQRFDPKEILERMDANKNGLLEGSEISGRAREFINRTAERGGLDPTKPLPIKALLQSMGNRDGDRDSDRGRDSDRDRSRGYGSKKSEPLVPGFGVEDERLPPPGFDIPADSPLASTLPLKERYDAKVIEYVEQQILRRYDRNGNDILENQEWKDVRWSSDPNDSDLNKDGRLTKVELCERIAKRWSKGSDRNSSRDSSSRSSSRDDSSRSSGSSSSGSSDSSDKVQRYVDGVIKQYDKNKNGVLEKDEWEGMRGDPASADRNRDRVITREELYFKLSGGKSSSSKSSSSSSSTGSSEKKSDSRYGRYSRYRRDDDKRDDDRSEGKSYRFRTVADRLPRGLPSWFDDADDDGDGQVKMAEFSSSWSDSKVAEFNKYDTDGDGIITPGEALSGEKSDSRSR